MFYQQLKSWRTERGFSIREVASRSGVSAAYISQLENGARGVPSPEILRKLSDGLRVPYPDLMQQAGYVCEDEGFETAEPVELVRMLRDRRVRFEGVELTDADKQWIEHMVRAMLVKEQRIPYPSRGDEAGDYR